MCNQLKNRVTLNAFFSAIAIIAISPNETSAQASSILRSVAQGTCSYPATASAGALIQSTACNASNPQRWSTEIVDGIIDTDGVALMPYRLRNIESNMCLDLMSASTANGVQLTQRPCSNSATQQWKNKGITYDGRIRTVIKNRYSNKCIDLPSPSGGALQQWDCGGAPNQRWGIEQP